MEFPLEPNRQLVMPADFELGMLAFSAIGLFICLIIALRQIIKRRDPLFLLLLIGGFFGEMLEPICNVLGMAYHPEQGQIVGFRTLGRDIPLWLMLAYPWYFATFAYQIIDWDRRHLLSKRRFWALFAVSAVFAFAIEVWPVQAGLWQYYGEQPLMVFGLPLMWYIVNSTAITCAAAFTALAVRQKRGLGYWPAAVTMPIAIVGFHTGVFAPLYIAENAGWSATQNLLPALMTALFSWVLLNTFAKLLIPTNRST